MKIQAIAFMLVLLCLPLAVQASEDTKPLSCANYKFGLNSKGDIIIVKPPINGYINTQLLHIKNGKVVEGNAIKFDTKFGWLNETPLIKVSRSVVTRSIFPLADDRIAIPSSDSVVILDFSSGESAVLEFGDYRPRTLFEVPTNRQNETTDHRSEFGPLAPTYRQNQTIGAKFFRRSFTYADDPSKFRVFSVDVNTETIHSFDDPLLIGYRAFDRKGDERLRIRPDYGPYVMEGLFNEEWVPITYPTDLRMNVYPHIEDKTISVFIQEFPRNGPLRLKKLTLLENEEVYEEEIYTSDKGFTPEISKLTGDILWLNTGAGIENFSETGTDALYLRNHFPGFFSNRIEWAEIEYSNFDTSIFLLHSLDTNGYRRIHFNKLGEKPILVCETPEGEDA